MSGVAPRHVILPTYDIGLIFGRPLGRIFDTMCRLSVVVSRSSSVTHVQAYAVGGRRW